MTYFDFITRNLIYGSARRPRYREPQEVNCYGEPIKNVDTEGDSHSIIEGVEELPDDNSA
jgi:hypothetical protein